MKRISLLLILIAFILQITEYSFGDETSPIPVEKALHLVQSPADGFGNMSPFEVQAHYRLMSLLHQEKYTFAKSHAPAWRALMLDQKANIYGRLCAAYFLLDNDTQARDFLQQQVRSKDLRHRYNAAEVLHLYVGCDATKRWGIDLLIGLVADGSLDGSDIHESPHGEYPDGDRDDIMATPLHGICYQFGCLKEKAAVPAFIAVLERRPDLGDAAVPLGAIGDPKAIPILLKILRSGAGEDDRFIVALGELKCHDAVPIMVDRLERSTSSDLQSFEIENLLEALLAIGDKRAIPAIEKYSNAKHPHESIAAAKRVLLQLNSADPATDLLKLLEYESDESEQSSIITALEKYPNSRVVIKLGQLSRTSDSAFIRRESIGALRDIATQESLLQLVELIDFSFPANYKSEIGWKGTPDFTKYFPEIVVQSLKQATGQDFGSDKIKWQLWIANNVRKTSGVRTAQ